MVVNYDSPRTSPPNQPDLPLTLAELRVELKGQRVPKSIFICFQRGVAAHLDGDYRKALEWYQRLRVISRRKGGTFDLYTLSTTFQHNWDLLMESVTLED